MTELPEGWTAQALGSIADCRLGKMLDAEKNQGELRPYLRNTNVQWGSVDLSHIKKMRIEDDERDRYAVRPGDLLVCEGGEPGRCAVWRDDREMYLQKALHRVRPLNGTSVEYLRWFLQHATASGALEGLYTGSTIKHLPGRQLAQIIVPIPPPDEQRRIAAWLDAIDARGTSIAERLAAARRIVERLRAAVLAAACSGSLTAAWRKQNVPVQTAAELASQIASRRCEALHREGPEASGTPGDWAIPEAWVWSTPEQLQIPERSLTYGVIKLGPSVDGGIPTLRSSDVRWLRIENDRVKHISRTIADQYRRTYLAGGEVLVTVRGTLGGVAVVPPDMAGWNVSREVAVVPLVGDVDPRFVACMIGSPQCQRWLSHVAKGVAYTGVNIADLKQLPLPLPPTDEQREIVRRVSDVLANANRLDAAISAAKTALDSAGRGALAKAFRGEITVFDTVPMP